MNCYEASKKRMEFIFNEFEQIYFSFSGGKDSSVMIQLANEVALKLNKKFDVLYIDLEGNYKATRNHVKELKENLTQINEFYWVCLPLKLRNGVSQNQTHWVCWDKEQKQNWVRPRPSDSINEKNYLKFGWDWFVPEMQFEDFIIQFAKWYQVKKDADKICCGVGIRTQESLRRWKSLNKDDKPMYKNKNYTTKLNLGKKYEVYNFYPIFDYKVEDIWTLTFKNNYYYNNFYEVMYKAGMNLQNTRLCQPYGDDQKDGLNQFKFFEPETWGKVLLRVEGVNFGNIYAKTMMLGKNKLHKPDHLTYEEYSCFLLETIGSINEELMLHYMNKIDRFLKYWEQNGIQRLKDFETPQLENKKILPSWRRICKMLMKNDFYGTTLSYSQTKEDDERLERIIKKWKEQI
jgi:predicted phosphoadenosine phosphosulfate sulfurtransferase